MPSEDNKIFEFNQYQKSDKAPFIIHADLECLIEKIDGCENNSENSLTIKVGEHVPSVFLSISLFKSIENEHDVYRGKDCIKVFCETLKTVHNENNYFKKKMKLLSKDQKESYENAKICYIWKEKFEKKNVKDKKYSKVRVKNHCH